jgi:hypothetical protein
MHVWIVDNACGHRFAGAGVGGLDCDVSHAHDPTTTTTEHDVHGPTTTAPTTTSTAIDPDASRTPRRPVAPTARPLTRDPDFTG